MNSRLQLMTQIDPYVGTYFSKAWVKKHVLHLNEEDVEKMDEEIAAEQAEAPEVVPQAAGSVNVSGSPETSQVPPESDINSAFQNQITK